jgi:hypothetical protein
MPFLADVDVACMSCLLVSCRSRCCCMCSPPHPVMFAQGHFLCPSLPLVLFCIVQAPVPLHELRAPSGGSPRAGGPSAARSGSQSPRPGDSNSAAGRAFGRRGKGGEMLFPDGKRQLVGCGRCGWDIPIGVLAQPLIWAGISCRVVEVGEVG